VCNRFWIDGRGYQFNGIAPTICLCGNTHHAERIQRLTGSARRSGVRHGFDVGARDAATGKRPID